MRHIELTALPPGALSSKERAHLVKHQFVSAQQVLLASPLQLARATRLTPAECTELQRAVARAVLAQPDHPHSLRRLDDATTSPEDQSIATAAFTTGDAELDSFFDAHGAGIRTGAVTELAGQSSSGKTNLCLQLACTVQLPRACGGLDGGTLFLSSEGTIPSKRLAQLARHWSATLAERDAADLDLDPQDPHLPDSRASAWTETDFLDNVHVETAPDSDTLVALLAYHVPAAIERIAALHRAAGEAEAARDTADPESNVAPGAAQSLRASPNGRASPLPIRLLILDSIAAPFRSAHESGSTGFAQRAREFAEIGDELKAIAARYGVAVVVVNQVSDVWDGRGRELPRSFLVDGDDGDDHEGQGGPDGRNGSRVPNRGPAGESQDPRPAAVRRTVSAASAHSSTSTAATSHHLHAYNGLPLAPHRQYHFPPLLYSRFQSPHISGAFASVSHPSLLPLPPGFDSPTGIRSAQGFPQQPQAVAAALGHTWSQIPTSRILCLVRRPPSGQRTRRCMTLVWSPFAPRACVEYEIDPECGIRARGAVRVRAVPGFENYEEEEDGAGGAQVGQQGEEEDEERRYWGSTEDLLDEHAAEQLFSQAPLVTAAAAGPLALALEDPTAINAPSDACETSAAGAS